MLFLSTKLSNIPLLSIRSAARVGTVHTPIINPHNLHIDGFWCTSIHSQEQLVLLDMEVRELTPRGIVIDDHQKLSQPDELVRLQPILELEFTLEGKDVFAGKRRIGKLAEYALDQKSLFVTKLYVQPVLWRSMGQNRLVFDRSSVLEVTDTKIVVNGPEEHNKAKEPSRRSQIQAGYSSPVSASSMAE